MCSFRSQLILLKEGSSHVEIVEALKHSTSGVGFLNNLHSNFPAYTFVSADAVQWLLTHLEGITTPETAIALLQVNLFIITIHENFSVMKEYFRSVDLIVIFTH